MLVSPTCVRASLLLANLEMLEGQYQQAAKILENVLEQNPDYTGEILSPLKHCYEELNQLDNFELFLIRAGQITNNDEVELALVKLIEEKDGKPAAQAKLYQQLTKKPSTLIFHRFMQYQIHEAEDGRGKESLIL